MLDFFIILFTSAIATFMSAMSGGGASIINLPVLLSLGVPFPLATAAQKVSSGFWTLPAAYNYLKNEKVNLNFLFYSVLIGLLGAYLGVEFIVNIDKYFLGKGVGFLILALVFITYFKKDVGDITNFLHTKFKTAFYYVGVFILGFYESIFGAGNGIMYTFLSVKTQGLKFSNALGHYFIIAFFWCVFASLILIYKGYWSLEIFIPIVVGSLIGGYFGSRFAVYKGNDFVKMSFVVIGLVLGLKLLLF